MDSARILSLILSVCLVLVIVGILVYLSPGFSRPERSPGTTVAEAADETIPTEIPTVSATEIPVPDLAVTEGSTFSCSGEEFIHYWNAAKGTQWQDWILYPSEAAPCTGLPGDRYTLDSDPTVHNEPTISLYVHDGRVSQISLSLAEHDWTQWREELFLLQCRDTLGLFFPGLTTPEIDTLAFKLYSQASELRQAPESCTVWYYGSTGCCACCRDGILSVCVVPVPDDISGGRYESLANIH